jgi:N-methylhydantoinase B/oxoprolinase/acetone carboxylase alpha subunit
MPPNSTMLTEEGAVFKSLKIVENNIFNEQGINIFSIMDR